MRLKQKKATVFLTERRETESETQRLKKYFDNQATKANNQNHETQTVNVTTGGLQLSGKKNSTNHSMYVTTMQKTEFKKKCNKNKHLLHIYN